jgi:DNA-binding transcriptional LysR family regulator
MDVLAQMKTFVRVAEAGSFTAVAHEQGTTQSTISRQIAALEQHLGARLLTRTTRALSLTEDGRAFLAQALRTLDTLAEAEGVVGRRKGQPTGLVRLATPVVFGRLHIVPLVAAFLTRYPEVSVEVVMSDSFTDLVEQGIDVAIRVGEITDQSLVAHPIGRARRLLVASPAYLKRHPAPRVPADLSQHECIVYTRLATSDRWHFDGPDGPISVKVSGRYRADNSEAVREGMLRGLGIAVIPAFAFAGEIEKKQARVLLEDFEPRPLPINAVYPSRRFVPLRVRALVDALADQL